jgi:hypothetical protein
MPVLHLSHEVYAKLEGANVSTVKELKRSARHYLQALEHERDPTAPLEFGLAGHMAIFEPRRFHDEVAIWPEDFGKRMGKRWDAFEADAHAARKLILRERDHALVVKVAAAVRASKQAQHYLEVEGEAEVAMQWVDPGTGIKCKGRLDWRCARGIADLKIVKDASPFAFGRAAHEYSWPLQAAWYSRGDAETHGGEILPFAFIAVEKTEPFVVQVYCVEDEVMEYGQEEAGELLAKLVELRKTWKARAGWPGYSHEAMPLQLPAWAWGSGEEASIEMLDDDGQGQEPGQEEAP